MSPPAYALEEVILKVEGVAHFFGRQQILRDVNFEIRNIVRPDMTQGQVVALLGPSGIGKTQLLRILAGLMTPTQGRVLLTDQLVPVHPGMVGMVTQNYVLFDWRTVLGNLQVAARQAGMPSAQARKQAMDLLKRFRLDSHAGHYPAQLSGGQRQRVAIAQQVLSGGTYLLMDEPFSGLDMMQLDTVRRLICDVANLHETNTIIVVTHDMRAAALICDTLLLLGRERDASGKLLPGATIRGRYDLIARGLAWDPDLEENPAFEALMRELRADFATLAG